jgi:hypothetical protein
MDMVIIHNWKTGKTFKGQNAIEALKDIINNDSKDYNYNFGMAQRTIEYFNIKL